MAISFAVATVTALTQARLKKLLHYNPSNGEFTRLLKTANCTKIGDVAGGGDGCGYLRMRIEGAIYKSHRLAFLYMTGKFPEHHTDHINGNRADNRWVNLRAVTQQENNKNKKKSKNNTSGFTGVAWHKQHKKWYVHIMADGKRKYLGYFTYKLVAVFARAMAEKEYNYHQNHGRTS